MISKLLYNLSMLLGYKNQQTPTYKTFATQVSTKRMSANNVRTITSGTTGISCAFDNSDISYKLVDIPTLKLFLAKNNLMRYTYVPTERDCDDFSYMCQGDITHWDSDLAVGIIWGVRPDGVGHAFNMCIGTDKQIWFIEPQHNRVFKPKKLWEITLLVM